MRASFRTVQNAQLAHFKQSLEEIWHTNRTKAKDLDGFAVNANGRGYPNGTDPRGQSTNSDSFFLDISIRFV